MAAVAGSFSVRRDEGFFLTSAIVITLIMIAGFLTQLLAGRSTFGAAPVVHAHAITFFGWVFIYFAQNLLVANGQIKLHKTLGWIAAVWIIPMLVIGPVVTVRLAQLGHVPFFFRPVEMLLLDPMVLLFFAALAYAAIALRRRTDWHRRLHLCAMGMLLSPAIGRIIPMPLLIPYAFEASMIPSILLPLIGMAADYRRMGRVHGAWWWGLAAAVLATLLVPALMDTAPALALYERVTVGTPGASVPPLAFPAPPPGPLVTGR